jgi:signal transduction histidine kinase
LSFASTRRLHTATKGAHPVVASAVESLLLEERTRWAMHIHDGLTQSVTSAVLEVQTLRHRIEAEPEEAVATLREIEEALRTDLSQIRQILFELQEGEQEAEPPLAGIVKELVERWKLSARVSVEGDLDAVPEHVLETAHGIVAEALANVARHAGTTSVVVRMRATGEELRVEVEDHGRGIPMAAVTNEDKHFGLEMMRTRAEETGGSIEIRSTPGSGTLVVAVLPVRGEVKRDEDPDR